MLCILRLKKMSSSLVEIEKYKKKKFAQFRRQFRQHYALCIVDDSDEKVCTFCDFKNTSEYKFAGHYNGHVHIASENKFVKENFGVDSIYHLFLQDLPIQDIINEENSTKTQSTQISSQTSSSSNSQSESQEVENMSFDEEDIVDSGSSNTSQSNVVNLVDDNPTPFLPVHYKQTLSDLHKMNTHLDEQTTSLKIKNYSQNKSMSKKEYVSDDTEASNVQMFGSSDLVVKLSAPLLKSVRDFSLFLYPLETTDRQRMMDKNNKKWQSEFANDLYKKDSAETPDVFAPTKDNRMGYKEEQWYTSIIQKMVEEYNTKLTNGSYNHIMVSDPIFCVRRFPNWCWGLDLTDIIKFFDLQRTYTKFKETFKTGNFCSTLNTIYPNIHLVELTMKYLIYKSKQEFLALRKYEIELQNRIAKAKQEEGVISSEGDKNTDNDPDDVFIEEPINDNNDSEKNDDLEEIIQESTDDLHFLTNMEWIDILLPKVKRSCNENYQKRMDKMTEKETIADSKEELECKRRRGRPGNEFRERVLPVVLLPFFLDSLHVSKKLHNPVFILCNDILRKLENYRHFLILEKQSTTEQIACLDLTIIQLKVNMDTYTNYKHVTSINLELEKGEFDGILEGIVSIVKRQQQQLADNSLEIKKMKEELDVLQGRSKDNDETHEKGQKKRKLSDADHNSKNPKRMKNL